jgi:hypothetical protein
MGPTVAIWLRPEANPPRPEELVQIARLLDRSAESSGQFRVRSTHGIGGRVSINDARPFAFKIGEAGFETEELESITPVLCFTPTCEIQISAFMNSEVDHRILGELAVFLARRVGGVVDFGGHLGHVSAPVGKLLEIPYMAGSIPAAFHVSDVAFLQWWLTQPAFHMIK